MKKLAVVFSMLLAPIVHVQAASLNTGFTLISGYDDVLRQAKNHSLVQAGLQLIHPDETFTGMPELYRSLVDQPGNESEITLISGTSSLFLKRVKKHLYLSAFPRAKIYLRNWLTEWSVEKFKIESIQKSLSASAQKPFLVIFDNSAPSLEMAKSLPENFPGQTLAIYLHEIVSHEAVMGAIQYITALDIALQEQKAGRLSLDGLEVVAQSIVQEKNLNLLIPEYAYCPVDYDPPCGALPLKLNQLCTQVREKVRTGCRQR